MTEMKNLKNKFDKAPKKQRQVLIGAAIAFIATFLPWSAVSYGVWGGFSYSGWHGFGMLTVLASVALILLWLLPFLGVKLQLPIKTPDLQKYLLIVMLAGPVIWLLQSSFHFRYLGFGFWLALIASGATLVIFLKK